MKVEVECVFMFFLVWTQATYGKTKQCGYNQDFLLIMLYLQSGFATIEKSDVKGQIWKFSGVTIDIFFDFLQSICFELLEVVFSTFQLDWNGTQNLVESSMNIQCL